MKKSFYFIAIATLFFVININSFAQKRTVRKTESRAEACSLDKSKTPVLRCFFGNKGVQTLILFNGW